MTLLECVSCHLLLRSGLFSSAPQLSVRPYSGGPPRSCVRLALPCVCYSTMDQMLDLLGFLECQHIREALDRHGQSKGIPHKTICLVTLVTQ